MGIIYIEDNTLFLIHSSFVLWIFLTVFLYALNIWFLIASTSAAVRRLRDAGFNVWWILVPIIPFILTCYKSVEENKRDKSKQN